MSAVAKKLEEIATLIKGCLDEDMTLVPTVEMFEAIKAAVLELEVRDNALKALPSIGQQMRDALGVGKPSPFTLFKATDPARQMTQAMHAVRGNTYAKKFLDAVAVGKRLGNFKSNPTLFVGSDHLHGFSAYLHDLLQNGAHVIDKRASGGPEWMGMKVLKVLQDSSRIEWEEKDARYWVDPEDPHVLHRSDIPLRRFTKLTVTEKTLMS